MFRLRLFFKGLYLAWKRYGRISWEKLLEPAINLAHGFPVQAALAEAFRKNFHILRSSPSLSKNFLKADGSIYKKGEILKRPELANTLKALSREGGMTFYNGSLSKLILMDLNDIGSVITQKDLEQYNAYFSEPISSYLPSLNLKVLSPPPPSAGAAFQVILKILDRFNFDKSTLTSTKFAANFYHVLIESFKFGFAAKTRLGDPTFNPTMNTIVKDILSKRKIDEIISKIDLKETHNISYYEPVNTVEEDHGTTHVAVLGPTGDAVSVTSTINLSFGARVVGKRTGIIFNDQMDDFSRLKNNQNFWKALNSPANHMKPGKRPQSSTCGSIFIDKFNNVRFIVGASGGTKIPPAVATVTALALWLEKSLKEAVDLARLHHQLQPNIVLYETLFPRPILVGLRKKGHKLIKQTSELGVAVCQALKNNCNRRKIWESAKKCLQSVSDFRKNGAPDAY